MKLTESEKALVQARRDKSAKRAADLKRARGVVAGLSDEQVLQIARQLTNEYKRITSDPGCCTCDSQWTNPKCPRVLAGWGGWGCDEPPEPVAHLCVTLDTVDN